MLEKALQNGLILPLSIQDLGEKWRCLSTKLWLYSKRKCICFQKHSLGTHRRAPGKNLAYVCRTLECQTLFWPSAVFTLIIILKALINSVALMCVHIIEVVHFPILARHEFWQECIYYIIYYFSKWFKFKENCQTVSNSIIEMHTAFLSNTLWQNVIESRKQLSESCQSI